MKKLFSLLFITPLFCLTALSQTTPALITAVNTPFTQNFDSLASTGTLDSLRTLIGWRFTEAGTGANGSYSINDGVSNTGNSYSYGTVNAVDRAMGTLASNAVQSSICAFYINQTGNTVTAVRLQFNMEQWRSGGRTTIDSSEFFYGINNGGFLPANGLWTKRSSLNLVSKIVGSPAPTAGARNGNDTANRWSYDVTISGISLNTGDTLYLRWTDLNVTGNDDGLSIDDFTITAFSGTLPAPNAVTSLTFTPSSSKTGTISFSRGGYDAASMTTLVFVKPASAITSGTPSFAPSRYTASSDFSATASTFENDSQARCVMKGDQLSVNITGLQATTQYHVLVYVIRDADSVYSPAATTNNTTLGNPAAVTSTTFLAEGQTTANLSWTKPGEYSNATYTTLVFVKINTGSLSTTPPASTPAYYTANANFSGNSTLFESDTLARCVYKGDAASVLISGLAGNTTYQYAVFTHRDSDSLYSTASTGSGTTLGKEIPASVTTFTFSAITSTSATINWTKPTTYQNDTHQVVVFLKAGQAIKDSTIHTWAASQYTASANFATPGSVFEHDSSAYSVYSGDGNSVNITGLNPSTAYYAVAYIIKVVDTAYSNSRTANFTTPAPPAPAPDPVSAIAFTQTALRTGRVVWTKPAGYINATHSTLVFIKAASSITTGTPVKSPIRYTATPVFGNGTVYDFDAGAYCVFRADTNFINIGTLPIPSPLSIVIHTVRDADSVYSTAATGSGIMDMPALRQLADVNKTNSITGVPDSLGLFVQIAGVVKGFNQRTNGLQFLLSNNSITNQQGITVFNPNRNFGYTVTENDSVWVTGTIGSNRGTVQITIDSLWKGLTTTVDVLTNVTALNEQSENKVIRLNVPVKFLTPPAGTNWPTNSSTISVVSAANDTFAIRLLNTSALGGSPLPADEFFLVSGIGLQISTSVTAPFAFNGYQIIPRTTADISQADGLRAFSLVAPSTNTTIILNEPLTDPIVSSWNRCVPTGSTANPTYTLEYDTITGDFSNPIAVFQSDNSGTDTLFSSAKDDILTYMLSLGYAPGSTISGKWRIVAQSGSITRVSTDVFNLNFVMPSSVGLNDRTHYLQASMYPNPAAHAVRIESYTAIKTVRLYNLAGMRVLEYAVEGRTAELPLDAVSRGMYWVHIQAADGKIRTLKLIVEK